MSRKRRVAHRGLVATQKREHQLKRRGVSCRTTCWRRLWSGRVFDAFRRPHDQMCRVAWIYTRCRQHRTTASCPVVIHMDDEVSCRGPDDLRRLTYEKFSQAHVGLAFTVVPFAHRRGLVREMGWMQDLAMVLR